MLSPLKAYIGTARKRISLPASCEGYSIIHARWMQMQEPGLILRLKRAENLDGMKLPEHTLLLTKGSDPRTVIRKDDLSQVLQEDPVVLKPCMTSCLPKP